jgi:MmyB-like transcription regulator ligand binding domain
VLAALVTLVVVELPNNARFIFLDRHAPEFFCDWDKVANDTVALLRAEAGRDPYDRGLSDLIGELSTRSEEFRARWAAHHVRIHTSGIKRFHHPVVGDLELAFESFPLAADPSQSLLTYTAEPGSPSHHALRLLASWAAATHDLQQPAGTDDSEQAESGRDARLTRSTWTNHSAARRRLRALGALSPRTRNTGHPHSSCSSTWPTPSPPRRSPPT